MQFLTLSRRRTEAFTDAQFAPFAEAESQRVRSLYAEGIIRQIWQRGDMPGACILFEAASEGEVRNALATLPLMQAGMLELLWVIPLQPYRGFGPR
ncbi:MAG TPA: muconolactone Delta-isomerase family protein [Candidatus Acidoferrales bacterium]|jgi:muconolactone delta-isomerase|nr:muconolactone Delta-isomerase family protein [Candidatus Acidoferrales bacterium]